jgi:hypothetical protein
MMPNNWVYSILFQNLFMHFKLKHKNILLKTKKFKKSI